MSEFYEDDEPVSKIKDIWRKGTKGRTRPPADIMSQLHISGASFTEGTSSVNVTKSRLRVETSIAEAYTGVTVK